MDALVFLFNYFFIVLAIVVQLQLSGLFERMAKPAEIIVHFTIASFYKDCLWRRNRNGIVPVTGSDIRSI